MCFQMRYERDAELMRQRFWKVIPDGNNCCGETDRKLVLKGKRQGRQRQVQEVHHPGRHFAASALDKQKAQGFLQQQRDMNSLFWYDRYKAVDSTLLAGKKQKSLRESLLLNQRNLELYKKKKRKEW